jgi:HEAT repeat protein
MEHVCQRASYCIADEHLQSPDPSSRQLLENLKDDANPWVRLYALDSLMHTGNPELFQEIIPFLNDDDIAATATMLLAKPQHTRALPALAPLLRRSRDLARCAQTAMERINDPLAIPLLRENVPQHPTLQIESLRIRAKLGDRDALVHLIALLNDILQSDDVVHALWRLFPDVFPDGVRHRLPANWKAWWAAAADRLRWDAEKRAWTLERK